MQDVPHLRANTFSGMERHPETTFCRTCYISEQTRFQGRSVTPALWDCLFACAHEDKGEMLCL